MTVFVLVFFALCLVQAKMAGRGTLYPDYLAKENTTPIQGIFVFLVFLRHYYGYITPDGQFDSFATSLNSALGQMLVTMFLFYSGYGVMLSVSEKGKAYTGKLPQKVLKILIHFNMALGLFLLLQRFYNSTYTLKTILLSTIGLDGFGNSNWYVFAILCLYLITWLSFVLSRGKQLPGLLLLTAFSVIFVLIMRLYRPTFAYDTALCYPLGAWVYVIRKHFSAEKTGILPQKPNRMIWYYLGLAAVLILFSLADQRLYKGEWMMMVKYGLFTVAVLLITMKIRLRNAILSFLGEHVFSIYILQRLPMIVFKRSGLMASHPYFGFMAAFLVTVCIAVLFDRMTAAFDKAAFRERRNDKKPVTTIVPEAPVRGKRERVLFFALTCITTVAVLLSLQLPASSRTVTITALDETSEEALDSQIYLKNVVYNTYGTRFPTPIQGSWTWYKGLYCWFRPDDDRATASMTDSIVLPLAPKQDTEIRFVTNRWKGLVLLECDGWETVFDTYSATDSGEIVSAKLPGLTGRQVIKYCVLPGAALLIILLAAYAILYVVLRKKKKVKPDDREQTDMPSHSENA